MTDAEIAWDLRLSPKTIRRMNDAAKIPAPVTVGARSLRWVRQKIVDWLAAGCPDRETTYQPTSDEFVLCENLVPSDTRETGPGF